MEYCSAHVRDVEMLPNGVIAVTIAACGKCQECRDYVIKFRSRRIVRLV